MATPILNSSSVTAPPPSRAQQMRTFLQRRTTIRPGIPAGHIDASARGKTAAQGLSAFFTQHTGHHVGFRYHDPGFLILPRESARLEPGTVITIEPGVQVSERGGGARIEDNGLVTESGHEVLSRTARNVNGTDDRGNRS
jgi:Xaa-Pro aminopeptidase